jgi:ribonuclease HI
MKNIWARKEAFVRYENNQMVITTPFDHDYVNELKSGTESRRWNPDKNVWTINISEREKVLEITRQYFDVIEENQPSEATQPVVTEPKDPISDERPLLIQDGDKVEIWTDGACAGNPGPGGYAVLFRHNGEDREMVGGFALTTNNRMEIMAAIIALESLKARCKVTIYSDSRYLVDAMMLEWAKRWQAKGWKRNKKENAVNPDLWQRLLSACTKHDVEFRWVKGHASSLENDRCNELAEVAARRLDLPKDPGYENGLQLHT